MQMKRQKFFQFLLIVATFVLMGGVLLHFKKGSLPPYPQDPHSAKLLVQNTYYGPVQPIPGDPYLVRVEVLIRDSAELGGVQIQSVEFNGQSIPLKPRDIFGNRGKGSFQLPPGQYALRWVVRRDKVAWPRTVAHEEEVTIDQRDLWVQITIEGEEASIR